MTIIEGKRRFEKLNSINSPLHSVIAILNNRDDHNERTDVERMYSVIDKKVPECIKEKVLFVSRDIADEI